MASSERPDSGHAGGVRAELDDGASRIDFGGEVDVFDLCESMLSDDDDDGDEWPVEWTPLLDIPVFYCEIEEGGRA